ncbi:hypothetical protein V2J85_17605 [Streptomyces sp. DSM 41528]|uniref:DUF304 domain-containing protein n=1 Tax=Streptomyces bugieae TaxID=3098223 RepID=A0ABU7NQK6_9ACTN|nr:hypothetical protein [Streptomyces sp. DSM 41528]
MDVARVVRRNYAALVRLLVLRLVLALGLCALPVVLVRLGVPNVFAVWLLTVAGMFVAAFTFYRLGYGMRVARCARVLRHYPLEFHTRVSKKGEKWTRYGNVFTVRVSTRGRHGAPLMKAVNAAGRRCWPQGLDGGVWVAGDLPFGGVMVAPDGDAMLFLKPADWDKLAPQRAQAGAERVERAERAGLTQKTTRAWMMRPGA